MNSKDVLQDHASKEGSDGDTTSVRLSLEGIDQVFTYRNQMEMAATTTPPTKRVM